MISRSLRSSKTFITLVVSVSVFTDILLQNLVVPVLPFALSERVGLTDAGDIQRWNSILLSAFGGALIIGSCTFSCYQLNNAGLVTKCANHGVSSSILRLLGRQNTGTTDPISLWPADLSSFDVELCHWG